MAIAIYLPTLVADLHDSMRLVLEEAFGPVASPRRVDRREKAVDLADQTTFGLSRP